MILDSIIDSLLLLTNACFKVLLFLWQFFLVWEMPKTWQKQFIKPQNFGLGFFTNNLKLVNSIPV